MGRLFSETATEHVGPRTGSETSSTSNFNALARILAARYARASGRVGPLKRPTVPERATNGGQCSEHVLHPLAVASRIPFMQATGKIPRPCLTPVATDHVLAPPRSMDPDHWTETTVFQIPHRVVKGSMGLDFLEPRAPMGTPRLGSGNKSRACGFDESPNAVETPSMISHINSHQALPRCVAISLAQPASTIADQRRPADFPSSQGD